MSLQRRLAALSYPNPGVPVFHELVSWLEDRYIRQLTIEQRGPLRAGAPGALHEYLEELGASKELVAASDAGDTNRVSSWLVNIALQYEYGDNRDRHEAAAVSAASSSTEPSLITACDLELVGLAAALGVTPAATSAETLQAVIRAARQRPRPFETACT
jgi:hypothetical protein